ncbi:MAG: hypothetical protein LN567_01060 [Rickettsia endosymbiont of Graphium doson]|nr:hypothetical protein [Rickettsia endosymbiont of Graphium doson]
MIHATMPRGNDIRARQQCLARNDIALLIAESDPKQKELMINLIAPYADFCPQST